MSKYFGTDGFRGEAGITLTADHAYKVGRFLGWYYNALRERNGDNEPARIVIGKDTRRSSYMFEYSLVAGLTASGADAYTERRKIIKLHSSLRLLLSNFPEHLSLHICCMKKVFTSRQRKRTKSVWVQSGSEDTER